MARNPDLSGANVSDVDLAKELGAETLQVISIADTVMFTDLTLSLANSRMA